MSFFQVAVGCGFFVLLVTMMFIVAKLIADLLCWLFE
jgi:hypothetical protein